MTIPLETLKHKVAAAERSFLQTQRKLTNTKKTVGQLESRVEELRGEIAVYELQVQAAKEKAIKAKEIECVLDQKTAEAQSQHVEAMSNLAQDRTATEKELERKKSETLTLTKQNDFLNELIAEKTEQINNLTKTHENQIAEHEAALSEIIANEERADKKLQRTNEKLEDAEVSCNDAYDTLKETKRKTVELAKQYDELAIAVQSAQQTLDKKNEDIESATYTMSQKHDTLEELGKEEATLQTSVDSLKAEEKKLMKAKLDFKDREKHLNSREAEFKRLCDEAGVQL